MAPVPHEDEGAVDISEPADVLAHVGIVAEDVFVVISRAFACPLKETKRCPWLMADQSIGATVLVP